MFYGKVKNKGVWEIDRNEVFTPMEKVPQGRKKYFMLLIPLKEHRIKLVNIFMQERRLLCKMQINSLYNQSSTLYTNHPDNIEIPPCWKELMTLNFYKSETYKTLQEKEKGL